MKYLHYIFFSCLLVLASSAHAQLILHKDIPFAMARQFINSVLNRDTSYRTALDVYVQKHGAVETSGLGLGLTGVADGRTTFGWEFRRTDILYSYVSSFRTNLTPPPLCQPSASESKRLNSLECEAAVSYFKQCHLFIFNLHRELEAVQPLHIPQPDYIEAKPACFDVYGMAPAQVVKEAMLIVVGYYDSRWVCSNGQGCASNNPKLREPDPLYKTTILVRFDKDTNGKLILSQDDTCLSPLNKYATIANARQALKKAGCQ